MKKLTFLLYFCFLFTWAFAQNIEISEAPRSNNNGTNNSYLFVLDDVSKKEADAEWKKFIGDFKAKSNYDKKIKTWFSDDVLIPRLSNNTIDITAKIIEEGTVDKQTTVMVWFDLGGAYINSEADSANSQKAQALLTEYAMTTSKNHAEAVVKEEEEALEDLAKDLKKLQNDNANYRKEIEKAKATIAKNEKNIEVNELDQTNKEAAIEEQKENVVDAKEHSKKFNF